MTDYATPWRLDDAITAARDGQREQAQRLLQRIVEDEPTNVDAWLWLGGVEVDPAAQYRALERVIALDPSNEKAQQGLAWLDKQYPHLSLAPVVVDDVVHVAEDEAATAEDDLFEDGLARPVGADPDLRCPYCGEWTNISDTSCTRCQYPLIAEAGRTLGASLARWFLALVWLLIAAGAGVAAYWAYYMVLPPMVDGTSRVGVSLVSLGGAPPLGNALSPAMLLQLANGTIVASAVLAVLGVLFVLGMLLRWRAVYVLQVVTLLLLAVSSGALIAAFWNGGRVELNLTQGYDAVTIVTWVLGPALIAFVVLLLLALAARREFFPQRVRVRIPDEPMTAREHFKRGKNYLGKGWLWASAREYERAVEQKPTNKRYNRALADVYAAMGDDAEETGEVMNRPDDLSLASNERG